MSIIKSKRVNMAIAFMLSLLMIVLFLNDTAQAAYSKYSTYSYSTGMLWWKKTYNCTVYKDSGSYITLFYGSDRVSTGFEYKRNTSMVIEQTSSFSIGSQTAESLNSEIDFSKLNVPVKVGGSLEKTSANTWGISKAINRTIQTSDPAGYYSYNVMLNAYKIKITGTSEGTVVFYAPASESYRSLIYNPVNASYTDGNWVKY